MEKVCDYLRFWQLVQSRNIKVGIYFFEGEFMLSWESKGTP